ncbi:L-ascorbate oxidase homolog, partial [Camellia sinensis]|uniref:L-ascorbate oxidase homolog n=1 Tax=Camellia sinensis TaxID=4442 RepID=UPI001036CF0D
FAGKTYRFRISNVGLATSINFRIQGHTMKLVEVEGSHTLQNAYSSLDIHLGQSLSVLITADQPPKDYYIVVSSRFTSRILTTTAILHYSNSFTRVFGPPPGGPTTQIDWSLNQARSIRWNLTASGPRPNPQGSYHYGMIQTSRTIMLANSAPFINGKQRYAVNGVSFFRPDTPLKLADYFNIGGVFNLGSIPDSPNWGNGYLATSVMAANFRAFVEIVFQNWEDTVQSWHIDGYSFFVVGMDGGQWTPASRSRYNLRDTVARCTTQVYPKSWTAIYIALDNVGMWNIRSENWARQYLGQQFYLRVYSPANSWRDEYPIPKNALLCGRASGRHTRPMAMQKSHIAHKRVLELRKTTRQSLAEVTEKTAELEQARLQIAELKVENGRLTGLVSSAEAEKQKAVAVIKDKYLRELAKLEGKKNAEIEQLKKSADDAELRGYKEGETTYIKQCEAAKDLFFKCGWRAAVEQLGHGPETEQQFLEDSDDEEDTVPKDTPAVNDPVDQLVRSELIVEDLTNELPTEAVLPTVIVLQSETGLRVDIDADLDDLFN